MSRLVSSSCRRVGDSCGEFSVDTGEWHNGTALSWYETEPAWKTRNDRISVLLSCHALPLLNIVSFENSPNQSLKGESTSNDEITATRFMFLLVPWKVMNFSTFQCSRTHHWGSISWLQIQDVWCWGLSSSASKHLFCFLWYPISIALIRSCWVRMLGELWLLKVWSKVYCLCILCIFTGHGLKRILAKVSYQPTTQAPFFWGKSLDTFHYLHMLWSIQHLISSPLALWCRNSEPSKCFLESVSFTEVTQHFRLCRRKATLRATVPRDFQGSLHLFHQNRV